jgi:antitoxin HicB
MYNYPVTIDELQNGDVMVQFPDVPEAMTYGETREQALQWAQDALQVALSGYMDERRNIPRPSGPAPGQATVGPTPMAGVKLCIYQAMRDHDLSQLALARRLHCDARQVRRLLDLDHNSTLNQLLDACEVLDLRARIEVNPAASSTDSSVSAGAR